MSDNQAKKSQKLPLSIAVISYNEENIISKMLDSVCDIASEIIIVDSHSTDNTIAIAQEYGAKVFVEDWKGHIAQKNSALEKCSFPWVLCLDCDEVLSPELQASIVDAIKQDKNKAFSINRKSFYLGKFMKFAWRPDWKLRLVNKALQPRWKGLDPHDYLNISNLQSAKRLNGDLLHFSYSGVKEHFAKTIDYAKISALSYYKSGKKFSLIKLIINPVIAFARLYLFNFGFLDGTRGFIAAVSSLVGTFLKYAFLFELELKNSSK